MKPPALPTSTAAIAAIGALLLQPLFARWLAILLQPTPAMDHTPSTGDGAAIMLVFVVLPTLLGLTWIWLFAVWREPDGWARLGMRPSIQPWTRSATLTGIASIVAGVLVVALTEPVFGRPQGPPLPIALDDPRASGAYVLILFIAAAAVAPAFEETVFRGIAFGWLRQRMGVVPASVVAAVPHAVIHADPAAIPALSVIFVLYGFLYERSGTLWAPILAHCVHNAAILGLALAAV